MRLDIDVLRVEMEKRGLSLNQCAKELGVSKSVLSKCLAKKNCPKGNTIHKICNFLGDEKAVAFLGECIDG